MKIKLLIISIAIALCLSAAPAMADLNFDSGVSVVSRTANYYNTTFGGGEFTLSTATLSTSAYVGTTSGIGLTNYVGSGDPGHLGDTTMTTSFQTFCVETNENIFPTHMVEYTILNWNGTNSYSVAGGKAGAPDAFGDPLDPRTAYLYTQFATGALSSSYNYNSTSGSPSRASDAEQLQKAIWYIEEEIGLTLVSGVWTQTEDAITALGAGTKALAWFTEADNENWTNIGNVRVLNLYDQGSTIALQDMLYLVPVPGAVLLGILGLGVAGIKLRKYA